MNKANDPVREVAERLERIERKLEFIEGQNRRLFFSQALYVDDDTALTWIVSGQRMFVRTNDLGISQHILKNGYWEKTTNRVLQSLLEADSNFVDVGAHLGFHTVTCAAKAGRGRHIAVEPNPKNVALLDRNLQINGLNQNQRVRIERCGVGAKAGTLRFESNERDPALGRLLDEGQAPRPGCEVIEVPVRSIDDICADQGRTDLLKIDVEGFEYNALLGARQTIARNENIKISLEIAPAHIRERNTPEEFLRLLEECGLVHMYDITPQGTMARAEASGIFETATLRNMIFARRPLPDAGS